MRNDYRDPEYARLAFEARRLWLEFQKDAAEPLLIDCGCLNRLTSSPRWQAGDLRDTSQ